METIPPAHQRIPQEPGPGGIALFKSERGSALVVVIIYTAALLFIGSMFLKLCLVEVRISGNHLDEAGLYYLTESGLELGLGVLCQDFFFSVPVTGEARGGSFNTVFITPPNPAYPFLVQGQRLVVSTGNLDGKTLTLQVIVQQDPGGDGLVIKEWRKP